MRAEQTNITLPKDIKIKAKKIAKENFKSLSEYVKDLMIADFKKGVKSVY